jgi:hypothetical protein
VSFPYCAEKIPIINIKEKNTNLEVNDIKYLLIDWFYGLNEELVSYVIGQN